MMGLKCDYWVKAQKHEKNGICLCEKTKAQISTFVFAIQIVQILFFLNPEFQAFSHLL